MFEPALGMERLGTIKEIANLVGIAESTVHRALKGTNVSDETRTRVISAVREINQRKIRLVEGRKASDV